MRRHIIFISASYCLGIAAASWFRLAFWQVYPAAVGVFFISFSIRPHRRACFFSILCTVLLLGSLSFIRHQRYPLTDLRRLVGYHPDAWYTVRGYVDSEPVESSGETTLFLRVDALGASGEWFRCNDRLRVSFKGAPHVRFGDRLAMTGTLKLSAPRRMYALRSRVTNNQSSALPLLLKRQAFIIRARMRRMILFSVPGTPGRLLSGMLLGERTMIPLSVQKALAKSGTAHILVISGLHVGLLGFLFMSWFKILGLPKRARIIITIFFLGFYCLMTGNLTSVTRATIMGCLFLSGYLLKRECEIVHLIAGAALIILILSPGELFKLSFQLSFLAVISIALVYPALRRRIPDSWIRPGAARYMIDSLLVSVSAWIGTAGLIACSFKLICPSALLANLVLIPLASLMIIDGICFLLMGFICPELSVPFAYSLRLLSSILLYANKLIINLPGAYFWLS